MSTMVGSYVYFQVCPEATSLENAPDQNNQPDVRCEAADDAERVYGKLLTWDKPNI